MNFKYEEIVFPKLEDINNLEYCKTYGKLKFISIIKRMKKIFPKLKRIVMSKIKN